MLDLGCNPGAFLQVACQHLGAPSRGGRIVGIDINVRIMQTLPYLCANIMHVHAQWAAT